MNDEPDASAESENTSKNGIESRVKEVDDIMDTKPSDSNAEDAKSAEAEENADIKNEQKSKDDSNTRDTESPIRLTLEEEETFHDDEVQLL